MLRKLLKISMGLFLMAILINPVYADGPAMPLSLKQCVNLALQNNVDVLLSRAKAQEAKGEQVVADADLLPQIEAVASQQRTWWENLASLGFTNFPGLPGTIGPYNSFSAEIMVSQRILDLSALAHAQASKIKWKASELEIELASQELILATGAAYIQVLNYEEQLNTSYEDVKLAQHFLDLSLHQLDAGLATSLDVARNRTQLAQEQARQEELRLSLAKAQLELKRLIKIPLSQDITLTDSLHHDNDAYLAVDDAIAQARQDRMEEQVAHTNSDYTLEEIKASKREHLPTIDLTGGYGLSGVTATDDAVHAANAMVTVTLPIWEGNRTSGHVKEAEGLNEEQQAENDDLDWKIEEDVRLALETLKSTHAQMDAFKKTEDFAQQELNLAEDRYSSGLGDNIQLIDAQVELADARNKYVQALAQYDQAQLNYFGAIGNPQQFDLSVTQGRND